MNLKSIKQLFVPIYYVILLPSGDVIGVVKRRYKDKITYKYITKLLSKYYSTEYITKKFILFDKPSKLSKTHFNYHQSCKFKRVDSPYETSWQTIYIYSTTLL